MSKAVPSNKNSQHKVSRTGKFIKDTWGSEEEYASAKAFLKRNGHTNLNRVLTILEKSSK